MQETDWKRVREKKALHMLTVEKEEKDTEKSMPNNVGSKIFTENCR